MHVLDFSNKFYFTGMKENIVKVCEQLKDSKRLNGPDNVRTVTNDYFKITAVQTLK